MLRFIVLSSMVCLAAASGYGGGLALGHGLEGYGGGLGYGGGGYGGHAVPAAVLSHHAVKFYDVPSTGHITPTTIDVPANILPVNFIFRSASSLINVAAKHEGAKGSFKETSSHDEPHILKHTVTKPIIQEINEIISPFRKITQTVEPVHEQIKTLVARGVGHKGGYGGHDGGLGGYGGEGLALGGYGKGAGLVLGSGLAGYGGKGGY